LALSLSLIGYTFSVFAISDILSLLNHHLNDRQQDCRYSEKLEEWLALWPQQK